MACILCGSEKLSNCLVDKKTYFSCSGCDLIFLNPEERLSAALEKARYQKHENNVLDQGYQKFVGPLFDSVTKVYLPTHAGLDYGSGPGSAISHLLGVANYNVQKYDPFFFNQPQILKENSFDYIIVCEVAEHFYDPLSEFTKLKTYLKPGGSLFVMTSLVTSAIDFATWSYRRDVTHVCFYSETTCQYLKEKFNFKSVEIKNHQVISFRN